MAVAIAVGLLGMAIGAAAPLAGAVPRPSFQVSISYTPSVSDPFQVSFSTTVLPGTPTGYAWNFGDGNYLNGSGAGFASPSHRYGGPGAYTVVLTVSEGTATAQQSVVVTLTPQPLAVTIQASNRSGTAPLEVTFVAVATGGTGTYPSFLWSFGTLGSGSGPTVSYSFVTPGSYRVAINVTDSAGHSAVAAVIVNVTAGGAPPPEPPAAIDADLLIGLGLGAIAGAVAGGLVIGRWEGRRRRREEPTDEPSAKAVAPAAPTVEGPAPSGAPDAPRGPATAETGDRAASVLSTAPPEGPYGVASTPRPAEGLSPAPADAGPEARGAPTAARPGAPLVSREALRLSQRIVLHLARQGVLGPDEVAPLGFSQPGMSVALGVRQNALTNVLRRLVAAGVLSEDVRHVRGQPRRLKVYRLTPRGEELARDLRRHPPPTPNAGGRSPPAGGGA